MSGQQQLGPVGIALVGMCWWGQKMLSVLQAAPADIRVVRAAELNAETVRGLCADKGIPLTADHADALRDPAVEAVVLATPHSLHTSQIKAAVAAGKHVFCEKPLALTKAKADSGALGRIHQIEANFSHDKFLSLDRGKWRLKGAAGRRPCRGRMRDPHP